MKLDRQQLSMIRFTKVHNQTEQNYSVQGCIYDKIIQERKLKNTIKVRTVGSGVAYNSLFLDTCLPYYSLNALLYYMHFFYEFHKQININLKEFIRMTALL